MMQGNHCSAKLENFRNFRTYQILALDDLFLTEFAKTQERSTDDMKIFARF